MELVMVSDLCFRPFSCAPLPAVASALLRPPVAASSHYCALLRLPVVAVSARPRGRHLLLPVADGASPQPALPVVASAHCRALLRRPVVAVSARPPGGPLPLPVADAAFPPPVRPVVAVSARPRGR